MAFKHGVYTSEVATSIISPVEIDAGLPVIFGTAPIHLVQDGEMPVNKPVLCSNYQDAVTQFGYSDDWESYTLCEFIYSQCSLFGYAPFVLINVLDSKKHKQSVAETEIKLTDNKAGIAEPVILSSLVVKKTAAAQPMKINQDYTAAFDSDGILQIAIIGQEATVAGQVIAGEATVAADGEELTSVFISYDKLDPTAVTTADIIGGIDTTTGKSTGLELIEEVFPRTRKIPGIIGAPKWSCDTEVAAVMGAKTTAINEIFDCVCVVDIPTDTVTKYNDVPEYKNKNNLTNKNMYLCWPMVKLGEKKYHLSTQAIGVINQTDASYDDIPYASPSNESLQCDTACLKDDSEISLSLTQANYLNGNGINTAFNFTGWKLWGNYTAAYPDNTDVKDVFLVQRRMMAYVGNTLVRTFWQKVDKPMNKALIKTILDSVNIWLNSLTGSALLGARAEFLSSENATTDLMNGTITFHVYMTAANPAQDIEFKKEYDPSYLTTLFDS